MGLFNKFFKKNTEPNYDSTNITVLDLDIGFVFDYDLSTWEVQAAYKYDWGDSFYTKEYKISDGSKTLFLSIEDDDELELSVSNKIKVRKLGILEELMDKQKPPSKIIFENTEFVMEEESPGYFHDCEKDENSWEEFIAWDFSDKSGEKIITVEQWEEQEFEASLGHRIQEHEISNILPANNN